VSIDGGAGALGATQPREAPAPSDQWVAPGRATAEDGVATGVSGGQLEVWSTVVGKICGMVGCVKNAYSFGAPDGVCPGSGCTPGLEPFHGSWTRVKRPGFSRPPGHPVTLREARHGPMGTSSQVGHLNTLPQTGPEGLFSAVRWHPTGCLRPATLGIRGSPFSLGHARPRELWSARGLRGPDCTLSHFT